MRPGEQATARFRPFSQMQPSRSAGAAPVTQLTCGATGSDETPPHEPGYGTAGPTHKNVRIGTASGDTIDAWLYLPDGRGEHPAVVMAHGIGAIKAGGLAAFAERFCHAGFAAVVFDYRQWGDSDGQPREELSFSRQLEDYRSVIGWAAAQPDLDDRRIFAWGTSFAGMYVVELAATDARLAGAIAQAPLVDGPAAARLTPPARRLQLLAMALLDRLGATLRRPPWYVPGAGSPGELAIGATPDALFGQELMTPKGLTPWRNRVAARSLLSFSWRRPIRRAADIQCPILLIVAEHDTMAPVGPALRVADKAQRGEIHRSRGGHYDVYQGGKSFDDVVAAELEFLRRHAKTAD
jgi:dipeptidyl aminopeptidase/acylaminoacyl peptidase